MKNCDCWHNGRCYATKDCELCECNGDKSDCDFYPTAKTSTNKPKKRLYTAIFEARCGISVMAASEDEAEKIALDVETDKIWQELRENGLELTSIQCYDK